jgi:hypothetical protein
MSKPFTKSIDFFNSTRTMLAISAPLLLGLATLDISLDDKGGIGVVPTLIFSTLPALAALMAITCLYNHKSFQTFDGPETEENAPARNIRVDSNSQHILAEPLTRSTMLKKFGFALIAGCALTGALLTFSALIARQPNPFNLNDRSAGFRLLDLGILAACAVLGSMARIASQRRERTLPYYAGFSDSEECTQKCNPLASSWWKTFKKTEELSAASKRHINIAMAAISTSVAGIAFYLITPQFTKQKDSDDFLPTPDGPLLIIMIVLASSIATLQHYKQDKSLPLEVAERKAEARRLERERKRKAALSASERNSESAEAGNGIALQLQPQPQPQPQTQPQTHAGSPLLPLSRH